MCSAEPKKFSRKKAHKVTLYDFLSAKMDNEDVERGNLNLQETYVNGSASDASCNFANESCPPNVDDLTDAIKEIDVTISKDKKFGLAPRFQRKLDERQRKQRNFYFTQQRRDNIPTSVPLHSYSYAVDPVILSNEHIPANVLGIPLNSCASFPGIYPNCLAYVPTQYFRSSVPLQFGGTTYFYPHPMPDSFIPIPFPHCLHSVNPTKQNVDGEQSDNNSLIGSSINNEALQTTDCEKHTDNVDKQQNENVCAEACDPDFADPSRKASSTRRRFWRIGDYCLAKYSEDGQYYLASLEGFIVNSSNCLVYFIEYGQMAEASLAELKQLHRDQLAAVRSEFGYRLNRQDIFSEILPQPPPFPFAPNGSFLIGSQLLPCYVAKQAPANPFGTSNDKEDEKTDSLVDKAIGPNCNFSDRSANVEMSCNRLKEVNKDSNHNLQSFEEISCKNESISSKENSENIPEFELKNSSAGSAHQTKCASTCEFQTEVSNAESVAFENVTDVHFANFINKNSVEANASNAFVKQSLNTTEQPQMNENEVSKEEVIVTSRSTDSNSFVSSSLRHFDVISDRSTR